MSGLMLSIMLARPAASLVAAALSGHAVCFISVALAGLAVVLRRALPRRQPPPGLRYGELFASMGQLARQTPVLQRRALYQACLFAAFSLFWTTVPLVLAASFHLSQQGIALFAFAGAAGAVAAPIAGRVADCGWSKPVTGLAMLAVAISLMLSLLGHSGSNVSLAALVLAAILLDFGVTANGVLGQRAIYTLAAPIRGRLNGLYMATYFSGGAIGSALGGWSYAEGGWAWTMGIWLVLPVLALDCLFIESRMLLV